MERLGRIGLLVSALWTLSCAGVLRPRETSVRGLRIGLPVIRALADIQGEFRHETVYCLTGHVDDGVVVVDAMMPPLIAERTQMSAMFAGCAPSAVAWYHNHPTFLGSFNCFPSPRDLQTLADNPHFLMLILSCALTPGSPALFVYRMRSDSTDSYIMPEDYGGPSPVRELADSLLPMVQH